MSKNAITATALAAIYRKNGFKEPKNLYATGSAIQRRKERGTGQHSVRKAESILERRFAQLWESLQGPALEREFRALANRRYRWDFAYLPSRLLIELNGGNFGGASGHNTGTGIERDAAKARAATLAGWVTMTLTTREVTATEVEKLIKFCREGSAAEIKAICGGD